MNELPRFSVVAFLGLLLVTACAAGARVWYVATATDQGHSDPALMVQGPGPLPLFPPGTELRGHANPSELDDLVANLQEYRWFGSLAPLAAEEEQTAHRAPGYPWIFGWVARITDTPDVAMRRAQCGLGTLAAICVFFFGRRAFRSDAVATLAGLFYGLNPFAVLATAELTDATLASTVFAACLMLGTRGSQVGGAFASLLYGLSLAGLAMIRAALLPFTLIAFLWFLWRCRQLRWGWFAALLAFLGYANGLAPWAVRNYRVFEEPVPVATSAYLHLWMGNNPKATGGPLDETALRASLSDARLGEVLAEKNQVRRYGLLGHDVLHEIGNDPAAALAHRVDAGSAFLLGSHWQTSQKLYDLRDSDAVVPAPFDSPETLELVLRGTLLAMLALGFLGWRWSYSWAWHSRLLTIAAVWLPLPYLLSHGDFLSGARLPFDVLLAAYAAFAVIYLIPGSLADPDPPLHAPEA